MMLIYFPFICVNGIYSLFPYTTLFLSVLLSKGIKGGIFYSMILTSIVGMIFGLVPKITGIGDVVGAVPSIAPTFGQAFINFGDIFTIEMLIVILTFLFVDFFDTAGTLVAVANQAGLMKIG